MARKNAPEKSPEKPAQPDYATEADIERAKRIAYLLEMKYGWQIKTDDIQARMLLRYDTSPLQASVPQDEDMAV